MTDEWHYSTNGQQHGPISASDLKAMAKSGEISSKDLIWKEGMDGWKPAGTLKGLFPAPSPQKSPPPLPTDSIVQAENPLSAQSLWKRCTESPVRYLGSALGVSLLCTLLLVTISSPDELLGRLLFMPLFLTDVSLTILLIVMSIIRHGYKYEYLVLSGKWHPVDGSGEALKFIGLNSITRGDTLSGTYILHKDKRIEIVSDGKVVESWKSVKVNGTELVFHDASGAMKKYKRNFDNPLSSLFSLKRVSHLEGYWQPITDANEWVQFTKDGAVVFSDGSAGRFTIIGEEPHEAIRLEMVGGQTRQFKIVSLTSNQLVIAEGDEPTTFRRNPSTSGNQQSSGADMKKVSTVGGSVDDSSSTESAITKWWDCPWCGTTYKDDNYNPTSSVVCNDCNCQFQTKQAINLRSTKDRVENNGFLARLMSGSSIRKPRRQFLIDKIGDYERLIRLSVNPATGGDVRALQQAQLLQMKIADMKQELASHGG